MGRNGIGILVIPVSLRRRYHYHYRGDSVLLLRKHCNGHLPNRNYLFHGTADTYLNLYSEYSV